MAVSGRQKGLEKKIVTSIISVGVMPMLVVLVVGFFAVRSVIWHTVEEDLENRALNLSNSVGSELKYQIAYCERAAKRSRLQTFLHAETNSISPEMLTQYKEYLNSWRDRAYHYGLADLDVLDKNGRQIVSVTNSVTNDEKVDYAGEPWWNRASQAGRTVVIEFVPDADADKIYTRILSPIKRSGDNEIIGYIHLRVEMNAVESIQNVRPNQPDDAFLVVERADKHVGIDLNDPGRSVSVSVFDKELSKGTEKKGFGATLVRRSHEGAYLAGVAILHVPYGSKASDNAQATIYIAMRRPVSAVLGGVYRVSILTLLGSALLLAVFCLREVRRIHNNIVRPVSLLNEGAQIIGQGDLELKLKINTNDEIEELAASFNRMALDLKANIHQLAESEEKYRELVTSMKEGIYQTNLANEITYANPAAAEIMGCDDASMLLGTRLNIFFMDEADVAWFKSTMQSSGYVAGYRCWMRWQDGEPICVELSASQLRDSNDQVVGTEGIFRDVTERVQLEREAREKAERISVINEIANAINSSLNIDHVLETVASEVRKLVEFDEADLMLVADGQGEFEHYRLWPTYERVSETHINTDDPVEWVVANKRRMVLEDIERANHPDIDGEMASKVVLPLVIQDNVVGAFQLGSEQSHAFTPNRIEVLEQVAAQLAVAVQNAKLFADLESSFEDVKRAREELARANEEMKSLDTMKTNLLSNVSHELRTPLVSIMGYTDMIYNEKVGEINPIQKEYLSISLRNIDRLVTLIENLLDFSRLHRGAESLVFETVDIVEVARASVEILRPTAATRNITIEVDASHPSFDIDGDKGKMSQVFINLLSNAVKFNKDGGHVWVRLAPSGSDSVEVSVRDTGIGIPKDELNKVFTRFYQCDSSSTRKYGGTGIGLNIAQDIVRLHGGSITVASTEGEGSSFRFTLPLSKAEGELPETSEPAVPRPRIVEVVTADDGLRATIRTYCERDEISLIYAASPDEAVALARRHRPDCIIIDATVSEKVDKDLIEPVKRGVTKSIPIIMISSEVPTMDDEAAEHIAAHLRPEFSRTILMRSIKFALDPRRNRRPPTGKDILVIDDEPEVIEFVRNCLSSEGYTVHGINSGFGALDEIRRGDYGMVLLDVAMPDMDGWHVCRAIKDDPMCADTHVCMVTARPESEVEAQIGAWGADGYILKPFRSDDLITYVSQVLPEPVSA